MKQNDCSQILAENTQKPNQTKLNQTNNNKTKQKYIHSKELWTHQVPAKAPGKKETIESLPYFQPWL